MTTELWPYLSYLYAFKLNFIVNIGYAIAALCYGVIYLKIKHNKDGAFRRYLMGYFGAAGVAALLMVGAHPYYNEWLLPVSHSGQFVALVLLTWYVLNEFWRTKNP